MRQRSGQSAEDKRICFEYAAGTDLMAYFTAAGAKILREDPAPEDAVPCLKICGTAWERTDGGRRPGSRFTKGGLIQFLMEFEELTAEEAVRRIVRTLGDPQILVHLREPAGIAERLRKLQEVKNGRKENAPSADAGGKKESAKPAAASFMLPPRVYKDPRELTGQLAQKFGIDPAVSGYQLTAVGVYPAQDGSLIFPGYDSAGCLVYACRCRAGRAEEIPGSDSTQCWIRFPGLPASVLGIFMSPVDALIYLSGCEEGKQLQCAALPAADEIKLQHLLSHFPHIQEILLAHPQIPDAWLPDIPVKRIHPKEAAGLQG